MPRNADARPLLTLGVVAHSRKENERRLPIHPLHFERIDADLRERIYLENGYGESFGVTDEQLAPYVAGLLPRDELLGDCDVIVLPKPQPSDLAEMREGQILWGWPHCVQDAEVTQLAIDRRLTLIAFEAMNHWASDGWLQAARLSQEQRTGRLLLGAARPGADRDDRRLRPSAARGRHRLRCDRPGRGDGAQRARCQRRSGTHPPHGRCRRLTDPLGADRAPRPRFRRPHLTCAVTNDGRVPLAAFLAENDIVVNCVLQDTDAPLTFLTEQDLGAFLPGSLIVDVSCDEGMGFSWARPTSFTAPSFVVGDNVHYYAVDHSPSYLWNSATWEISEALLPHLRTVLAGPPRGRPTRPSGGRSRSATA